MSISQRKDGRWCVKYKIDTPTGQKWTQRSFPKDKEAEARAFELEAKYEDPENPRPTLLECVLAYIKEVPHADHTAWEYEYLVCGYDRKDGTHTPGPAEFLAGKFADMLDKRDLWAFRDSYRARKVADATIAHAEQQLKAALSWCAGEDIIPESPWAKYPGLRDARHGSHMGTMEDFQRIYACLPDWMHWPCRVALACCLRPGIVELFRLRWSAFDWRSGTVTVYMGKVRQAKTVYPPEEFLAEARIRFEEDGQDRDSLVCRGRNGQPVGYGAYGIAWRKACRQAGVRMPMYGIRHIGASELLAKGIDLAAVAAQLGHRDFTTTGRYYAHALPAAQKAAARALPYRTTFGADGADLEQKA